MTFLAETSLGKSHPDLVEKLRGSNIREVGQLSGGNRQIVMLSRATGVSEQEIAAIVADLKQTYPEEIKEAQPQVEHGKGLNI